MATDAISSHEELTETGDDQTESSTASSEVATAEPDADDYPVSLDNIFEILKNQRRRHVLWYLAQQEGAVSLRDLSEFVAAEENEKPISQLSSQERKRVYVGLYQCHLPKMDDMGFVKFNKDRGFIELGPAAVHAEKYLHEDEPTPNRWPMYYLSLVGVGWLLLVGSLVTPLSAGLAAGVLLTLLTACALFQAYTTRTPDDDDDDDATVASAVEGRLAAIAE
ncbi:DUF7344 domain-containing protein [Halorarius litoreus]|uniref:DUF7344 domain-containing protein n=1 Tax=Halorarius litoreus TaxID=2962676 RepID=UPI0020CEDC79|nr:hypothetical protein [Halorarius litoreus]